MKVKQIKNLLNAELIYGEDKLDMECMAGCGCDLMSDVLAFSKVNMVLLTGLTNPQVIRTCEMLDAVVIVFVRGKIPSPEVIELAKETDIAVLRTEYTLYEACGILFGNGLPGRTSVR